jgi:hypothetical protein
MPPVPVADDEIERLIKRKLRGLPSDSRACRLGYAVPVFFIAHIKCLLSNYPTRAIRQEADSRSLEMPY